MFLCSSVVDLLMIVLFSQLDRFIPISKLKYYFAVDTIYVGKKLGLLVFPYMHEVLEGSYCFPHNMASSRVSRGVQTFANLQGIIR